MKSAFFSLLLDDVEETYRSVAEEEANDRFWSEIVNDDIPSIVGYKVQLWQSIITEGEQFFKDYEGYPFADDVLTVVAFGPSVAFLIEGLKKEAKSRMLKWLTTEAKRIKDA